MPVLRAAELDRRADPSGDDARLARARGAAGHRAASRCAARSWRSTRARTAARVVAASAGNHGAAVAYAAQRARHAGHGLRAAQRPARQARSDRAVRGRAGDRRRATTTTTPRRWPRSSPSPQERGVRVALRRRRRGARQRRVARLRDRARARRASRSACSRRSAAGAWRRASRGRSQPRPSDPSERAVWGAQSEASCAMAMSLETGAAVERLETGRADAGRGPRGRHLGGRRSRGRAAAVAGVVVVTEEQIAQAMEYAYRELGLVIEGSAAAALAPVLCGLPEPRARGRSRRRAHGPQRRPRAPRAGPAPPAGVRDDRRSAHAGLRLAACNEAPRPFVLGIAGDRAPARPRSRAPSSRRCRRRLGDPARAGPLLPRAVAPAARGARARQLRPPRRARDGPAARAPRRAARGRAPSTGPPTTSRCTTARRRRAHRAGAGRRRRGHPGPGRRARCARASTRRSSSTPTPDIRLMRRIRRDLEHRGRTFAQVRKQYYETVRPMHLAFVEPSKRFADVIIPEGGHNRVALELLLGQRARVASDRIRCDPRAGRSAPPHARDRVGRRPSLVCDALVRDGLLKPEQLEAVFAAGAADRRARRGGAARARPLAEAELLKALSAQLQGVLHLVREARQGRRRARRCST